MLSCSLNADVFLVAMLLGTAGNTGNALGMSLREELKYEETHPRMAGWLSGLTSHSRSYRWRVGNGLHAAAEDGWLMVNPFHLPVSSVEARHLFSAVL